MGFCLFEQFDEPGYYFAINPSCVKTVIQEEKNFEGAPVCKLILYFEHEAFIPRILGIRADVQDFLIEATKIGSQALEINIVGSAKVLQTTPLILNNPGRVGLVREMMPEELSDFSAELKTASEIFMDDGKRRVMMQRPGVFAFSANAGGQVPILEWEE